MPDDITVHPFPREGRPVPGVTALRGDDALARAASDVAAPRRRLLAGLRDAHAETCARTEALREVAHATGPRPLRHAVERLLQEAEEQLRRLELIFAELHERPGGGRRLRPAGRAGLPVADGDAAVLALLAAEERRGAAEMAALRELAGLCGHHMAARLLDLTAGEREAASRALAPPAPVLPARH